jgi:hypothetical protein
LIKKHPALAVALIVAAINLTLPSLAIAQVNPAIERVRAKVQLLSASKDTRVEVKFRDKTKVRGYITAVEPVSFNLRDSKSGASQSIAYSEVDSVTKAGGVSTTTWLIIGGIAAGAVTTWLVVKPAVCDGGAQTKGIC